MATKEQPVYEDPGHSSGNGGESDTTNVDMKTGEGLA